MMKINLFSAAISVPQDLSLEFNWVKMHRQIKIEADYSLTTVYCKGGHVLLKGELLRTLGEGVNLKHE